MAVTIKGFASDWSVPGPAKAALDGLYDKVDPQGRQPVRKGELLTNVRDHGAKGDGTTDDTAAIQALIDTTFSAGGGVIFFPAGVYRITTLALKAYVQLQGSNQMYGYGPQSKGATRFRPFGGSTGWMIDANGAGTAVTGIDFNGTYDPATAPAGGIKVNGNWTRFTDLHFDGFKGPALKTETGYGAVIDNILAINCVLDRTVTVDTGTMDIAGNDHYITRVESSCSLNTAVTSANLYVNAWVIRGANIFMSDCVGEFGDRGYLVLGEKNRFTGVRADRNCGLGWEIRGGTNAFAGCSSVDNARAATDTYPSFKTTGARNSFAGCVSSYRAGNLPTYSFEDSANNINPEFRNSYVGCIGKAARQTFSGVEYSGSSFLVPNHPYRVGAANPTTIAVDQSAFIVLTGYTAATTVTDFTGGSTGQSISVLALTGFVTLAHSSTLKLKSKANTTLVTDTVYRFARYNGVWYEV